MPIPISRESLSIGLEERYSKQSAGGAFDAKAIVTTDDTISPLFKSSDKGQQYTIDKGGFRVKQPIGLSNLADVPDRRNSTSRELSNYTVGFSNKKYWK